jgi:hypothetical protein
MFISVCITFSCQKLILDKNHVCCAAIVAAFSEIQKSGLSFDKPLNLLVPKAGLEPARA